MLTLLLKHGAKVNAVNLEGLTTLDLASQCDTQVLLKYGAISGKKK